MKVFVRSDYDEYGYSLTPVKEAEGHWLRQNGIVYDIPKWLVCRYEKSVETCEDLREQIGNLLDSQEGEPSPYRHEDGRAKPKITTVMFQLRHVKTRAVMVEFSVPVGHGFEWLPQLGSEPDGECQWWARFPNEDATGRLDFVTVGGPIRYDRRKSPSPEIYPPPHDEY